MTAIGIQPISLRNATLTVAEDDFTQSVNEVTFTPQVEYEWIRLWQGDCYPVYTSVRWVAVIGYAQDLTTPGSLSLYLLEHAAQTRTLTFTPMQGSGQPTVSAEVMIIPGQFGGAPGQMLTGSVGLPLFGDPLMGMAP